MNRIIDPILINFNIFDILVFVESDDKPWDFDKLIRFDNNNEVWQANNG